MHNNCLGVAEHSGDPEENKLDEKFEAVMNIISVMSINTVVFLRMD